MPEAPNCWFASVRLQNFRSYPALQLALEPGLALFYGPNGAGKTNFLEALSLFAPGRGLRKAQNQDLPFRAAHDQTLSKEAEQGTISYPLAWAVSVGLHSPLGQLQLGTGQDPAKGERRLFRLEGKSLRGQAQLPNHLSILWLTPRMDGLFVGSASDRRGFLDQLVMSLDPGHAASMAAYLQAMRERGRLLKLDRAGKQALDPMWLSSLEESMARHGVAIAAARRSYVRQLSPLLAAGQAPFPGAACQLQGCLEQGLEQDKALTLEDAFRETLHAARPKDQLVGRALMGPHTSDLNLWHGDHGRAAADCSTGEQKALLVAILLAHARLTTENLKRKPILLLDEVAAHFDANKRAALFEALDHMALQVLLTGTDRQSFESLPASAVLYEVGDQRIQRT